MSVNYVNEEDECDSKLTDVYEACIAFYSLKKQAPPSKDLLGKLIPRIFGVSSTFKYDNSQQKKIVVYKHLKVRPQSNSPAIIPAHCSTLEEDNAYKVRCPLPTVVDGKQQFCDVTFGKDDTWLTLNNIDFKTGFPLQINQENVNGMLNVICSLKLCTGIKNPAEFTSKAFFKETCCMLNDPGNCYVTQRSKSCKILINWTAKSITCHTCEDSYNKTQLKKKNKKRVHEDENKSQLNIKKKCGSERPVLTEITNTTNCIEPEPLEPLPGNTTVTIQSNEKEANSFLDETLEKSIPLSEEDHDDLEQILNLVLKMDVPENFAILLKSQLNNCKKGIDIHQRRWDPKIISLCLTLFIRSPQAYNDLKKSGFLELPSKRLLQYYKNSVKQTPGFNKGNLTWMMKEMEKQNVSEFGRHGGIIIDEMSIQDDLIITKSGDSWNIVGFVDMDRVNNNIDIISKNKKTVELATHALQFVFHGLTGFRWPVAYFGSCTATAHQLYNTFWKCVDLMDDHGFTIDYVMADGASTNRTFTNMLFNEINPRENNFVFNDTFCKSHKMCAIQDIMHVIKKIRNNIESSKQEHKTKAGRYLIINDKPIIWEHWMEAFKFNFQNGFAIHHKLTEEHIILTPASKMRNQLAVHVLNKDMLYLMRSYQATLPRPEILASTVKLLEHTSQLVEIFCTQNQTVSSMDNPKFEKLRNIINFFNTWEETVDKSVMLVNSKNLITRESREDINSSLMGFISLCEIMLKNGNSINPGYMNSDLVENLFGQQRGIRNGANTNPTLAQYGPANTAIILGQCSVSNKSNSGKAASFFTATTPCPLNPNRNKSNISMKRGIRL